MTLSQSSVASTAASPPDLSTGSSPPGSAPPGSSPPGSSRHFGGTDPADRTSLVAGLVRSVWPFVVALIVAGGLHAFFGFSGLAYEANIASNIGIVIIAAVSLTLVNGFTGQFSIGHAGFVAVGGYAGAAVLYYGSVRWLGDASPAEGVLSWTMSFDRFSGPVVGAGELLLVVACLVGGLAAAVAGLLVGLPSLRLRGDYLAIVTLGFGEIVRVLIQTTSPQLRPAVGESNAAFVQQVREMPAWSLATHLGQANSFINVPFFGSIFWIYLFAGLTTIVALRLKYSTHGRAYLSIREDEIAAEAMGIRTTRYKVQAFVLASFFAGIAGVLVASQLGQINARELNFMRSFEYVIIVVLGGLGSVSGAIIASIFLTVLPEALQANFTPALQDYRLIIYALILIVTMIVRPKGLLGVHELWEIGWVRRLLRLLRLGGGGGGGWGDGRGGGGGGGAGRASGARAVAAADPRADQISNSRTGNEIGSPRDAGEVARTDLRPADGGHP